MWISAVCLACCICLFVTSSRSDEILLTTIGAELWKLNCWEIISLKRTDEISAFHLFPNEYPRQTLILQVSVIWTVERQGGITCHKLIGVHSDVLTMTARCNRGTLEWLHQFTVWRSGTLNWRRMRSFETEKWPLHFPVRFHEYRSEMYCCDEIFTDRARYRSDRVQLLTSTNWA